MKNKIITRIWRDTMKSEHAEDEKYLFVFEPNVILCETHSNL
jgi:hypothetical protein